MLCHSSPCSSKDVPPPPYVISIGASPKRLNAKSLKTNEIKLEWIPYTVTHAAIYGAVAALAFLYNTICFFHNFGRMPLHKDGFMDEVFGEEALLCSVVIQWLLIFSIFISGIVLERCVPQPLHIFLSVLATNANAVLFVLNIRKVIDEVIPIDCQYFIFIVLLFILSVALCCAYIVAITYYKKQKRLDRSLILSNTVFQARQRRVKELEYTFDPTFDDISLLTYSPIKL
ncbi:unnamed protein product [Cylicocyclus nassatus]|uniref:Uncharacterized protein n=1 Tax=Cylicocyclus nassatus TaxID=53992 RepID=A0AA36GF13_CYLNA|nr:unnamed protein product [Cylicocyclus nassatus]